MLKVTGNSNGIYLQVRHLKSRELSVKSRNIIGLVETGRVKRMSTLEGDNLARNNITGRGVGFHPLSVRRFAPRGP